MARKIKLEDPLPLKNVLGSLLQELNFDAKILDYHVMQLWVPVLEEALEPDLAKLIAKHTAAHRITKDRKLVIGVKTAIVANELQFLKTALEEILQSQILKSSLPNIKNIIFELRSF